MFIKESAEVTKVQSTSVFLNTLRLKSISYTETEKYYGVLSDLQKIRIKKCPTGYLGRMVSYKFTRKGKL